MIDIKDLLENETVKGLLSKAGVSGDQTKVIAEQAVNSVKSKFEKNPVQMASLLSENDNTEDDEKLKAEVEEDFLQGLMTKAGISESMAGGLKGMIPGILAQITGKLSGSGQNNASGIAGLLGNIGGLDKVMDMFGGDDSKSEDKSSGIGGMIGSFFGK